MKILYYTLKSTFKDKVTMWWAFIFPFVLATLFNLAFTRMDDSYTMKTISIGVCGNINQNERTKNFDKTIKNIEIENGDKMFKINYDDEKTLKNKLKKGKISAYYIYDDKISLKVGEEKIDGTIMSEILKQFNSSYDAIVHTAKKDPMAVSKIAEDMQIDFSVKNATGIDSKNMKSSFVYYYGLLAMCSLYAVFYGSRSAERLNAMNSPLAQRISVSPKKKMFIVFTEIATDMLIALLSQILLVFYLTKVLGIFLGNNLWLIVLATWTGSLFAVSFSIFIGMFKISENARIGILLATSMTMAFLSDLMVGCMRVLVKLHVPIVNQLNPAAHIADAVRSLGVLGDYSSYWNNIFVLFIMSAVTLTVTIIKARRNVYDNL